MHRIVLWISAIGALTGEVGCAATHARPAAAAVPAPISLAPPVADARPVRWTRARDESPSQGLCEPALRARIVRDLRISDPGYCEAQVFVGGGERLLLVIMAFGPVQDCPSGCIQRHATALVRGERIVPVAGRNMLPDSSASWDIALRQALSENGISDAATQELRSESNDGRCSAPATLESEGDDDVYWVFRLLTPKTCVGWRLGKPTGLRFEVDGEVRIYLTGTPLARPLRVSILTP